MWPFVLGLLFSASCPRGSSTLKQVSEPHSSEAKSHSVVWVSASFGSRYNHAHFTDIEMKHHKGFSCLLSSRCQDVRCWKECRYYFQFFSSPGWIHAGLLLEGLALTFLAMQVLSVSVCLRTCLSPGFKEFLLGTEL